MALTVGSPAVIVGSCAIFMVLYYIGLALTNPLSRVPGPWHTRWTSAVVTYHWLQGRKAHFVQDLHEKYGPVVRVSPQEVDFTDLDAFKTIYNHRETYVKTTWYRRIAGSPLLTVFNTSDVDVHRRHRRLLGGPMAESALAQHIPTISARVDLTIQRIREEAASRGCADVWQWCLFMATDVIGELTFGESFKMLEQGKGNRYSEDLKRVAPLGALRSTFPTLVDLANYIPLPAFVEVREAIERRNNYAKDSLSRNSRLVASDPSRARQTLFTHLLAAKADDRLTFEELVGNAGLYIVAGSDTTANTLTYLIWEVCRHPAVKARLVAELRGLPADWSEADLRKLPYLGCVIDEALRRYSAVPSALPRVVPSQGADLAGYFVPGGTVVCAQAFSMHLNPSIYPSPQSFDPSRWENPTKEMKDSFFAFGGGSRVCLGKNLALIELRLATARFFLEFPNSEVSRQDGMCDEDMDPKIWFFIMPKGKRCLIDAK